MGNHFRRKEGVLARLVERGGRRGCRRARRLRRGEKATWKGAGEDSIARWAYEDHKGRRLEVRKAS